MRACFYDSQKVMKIKIIIFRCGVFDTDFKSEKFRTYFFDIFSVIFIFYAVKLSVFWRYLPSNNGIVYFLNENFSTPWKTHIKIFHIFQCRPLCFPPVFTPYLLRNGKVYFYVLRIAAFLFYRFHVLKTHGSARQKSCF